MRQIIAAEYDQEYLLPARVEDWVGEDHPARFVREFVREQDLQQMGLDQISREEGGPALDPRLLLSAWLYGYFRKIRSTRALERACREDMGFIWLTGNVRPDHNSLWRFWSTRVNEMRQVFLQTVKVALKLDLVGLVVQALDGTKVQAACRGHGGYNKEHLQQLLTELEKQLTEREKQIMQSSVEASTALPKPLQKKQELKARIQEAIVQIETAERKHVQPKEIEAARMECEGRNRFAYNAQAVVDEKAQVVLATDVTNDANDSKQLVRMIAQSQQATEPQASNPLTMADGGYSNAQQLCSAQMAGYPILTPPPNGWRDTSNPYHAANFKYDQARNIVICPQNREIPWARTRTRRGKTFEVFRSVKTCKDCPVRAQCTKDRHGRTIDIQPEHAYLVEAHRKWNEPATAEAYQLRAATIEPVFAQIKQNMGFRRFTMKGLEKVKAQWAMVCTSWNLKVLFKRWLQNRSDRSGPTCGFVPRRPSPISPAPSAAVAIS